VVRAGSSVGKVIKGVARLGSPVETNILIQETRSGARLASARGRSSPRRGGGGWRMNRCVGVGDDV